MNVVFTIVNAKFDKDKVYGTKQSTVMKICLSDLILARWKLFKNAIFEEKFLGFHIRSRSYPYIHYTVNKHHDTGMLTLILAAMEFKEPHFENWK
jgi:hypothetical protein